MVNIWQDVSECENKELWIKAYTLTLVPKWVQGYMWIKEGCEIIEGELIEIWLYYPICFVITFSLTITWIIHWKQATGMTKISRGGIFGQGGYFGFSTQGEGVYTPLEKLEVRLLALFGP